MIDNIIYCNAAHLNPQGERAAVVINLPSRKCDSGSETKSA